MRDLPKELEELIRTSTLGPMPENITAEMHRRLEAGMIASRKSHLRLPLRVVYDILVAGDDPENYIRAALEPKT